MDKRTEVVCRSYNSYGSKVMYSEYMLCHTHMYNLTQYCQSVIYVNCANHCLHVNYLKGTITDELHNIQITLGKHYYLFIFATK